MRQPGIGDVIRAFARKERGSATIEAVLWTPIFLLLFGLLTDTSLIFGRQAEILRVVQDANRSLAVGHFLTVAEAKAYISTKVATFSRHSTVLVAINQGIISSSVSMPATDLTVTGLFQAFSNLTISVAASQMLEV